MQDFPKNLFCTIRNLVEMLTGLISQSARVGTWRIFLALMFRSMARVAVSVGLVSVSIFASLANAQISPNLPNPIASPQPLTMTLSIFRSNMQDKIMKSAEAMPESKYSYRPTKDVRSFGEILTHVADISYYLCANAKGENPPGSAAAKGTKAEIMTYVIGAFAYCDGAFSGFTDVHLNDPADFWGFKTNKMFILTQVGNHDALHYGNLVTYLRLNGLEPSGGWF
ncbi:MAG TPA: DinB family protein [Silvibacterium sp.]|nr:DinB family protein [Silvibacterium sp.]